MNGNHTQRTWGVCKEDGSPGGGRGEGDIGETESKSSRRSSEAPHSGGALTWCWR